MREIGSDSAVHIGFGGARGGGKSGLAQNLAVELALTDPGCVVFIGRRHYADLTENYVEKFSIRFPWMDKSYRNPAADSVCRS